MPTNIRYSYLTILLLLIPSSVNAQHTYTEKAVTRYGKALNVATLDPTLSSTRLDDWLRSGPPRVDKVRWQMSPNCDRKPVTSDIPYSELPLCIKIYYERGGIKGWGMITVGTIGKGPAGPPHLQNVEVEVGDQGAEDNYISGMSFKLSDLPLLLDELSYTMEHKGVIGYTKALDVATLDQALSSRRLDDWLHSGPAHSDKLAWGVSFDCDATLEKNTVPVNESPLCVTVVFGQGDIRGWATILIGTFGKGPSGPPRVKSISVQPMSGDRRTRQTSDKLSDLPRLLDEVSSLTTDK